MKFPARTPKLFVDCIEGNNLLELDEGMIEKYFQVKAWRIFHTSSGVGLQVSISFHTSDGVGIEEFPIFPEKGTEEYEYVKSKIVSFSGFLNLRSEDLSEDQYRILSTLDGKESKPIQLYGALIVVFKPKIYTGKDGVEKEVVEVKVYPHLDTFQVGKTLTYDTLKDKSGQLPRSLFR